MAYSLTFNSIDMSDYGLYLNTISVPMMQEATYAQFANRARAWDSHKPPKVITLDINVVAASLTTLKSYLDSIRSGFNENDDKSLALDMYDDRYWLARFKSLNGNIVSPTLFRGDLVFVCHDPLAYSNTEYTSGPTNVDADPKTITITPGGTGLIRPVFTLTAGELLAAATIVVDNDTLGEDLIWVGTLANGKDLEIDVPNWIVNNDDVADMDDVSGQFPTLAPATANSIIITGFGVLGTITTVYRNRYV